MNKLANMRQWSERMSPNFGMSRAPNMGMPPIHPHQGKMMGQGAPPINNAQQPDSPIHLSCNVPFASGLAGPNTEDILHATTDAVLRWTHPEDAPDDIPVHELPVHVQNLNRLHKLCCDVTVSQLNIEAHVVSSSPKHGRGQITTVCLSGPPDLVWRTRQSILNETALLRCTTIDVEGRLVCDLKAGVLIKGVLEFLDTLSRWCRVDIFLLGPKLTPMLDGLNGGPEVRRDNRWRVAIYGDVMSCEHAKMRLLVHIDQLLGRIVDGTRFELSLQQLVCGRNRKTIKQIEFMTNTAIYFPPPFSSAFTYMPPNAQPRDSQEIFITGEHPHSIERAKRRLHEELTSIRLAVKDVQITPEKLDSMLLTRINKVRKIMDVNGTHVMFPVLGARRETVRVQGLADQPMSIERTVREIEAMAGQFYWASWYLPQPEARLSSPADMRAMLVEICANSGAEISLDKFTSFFISGSDESVKAALLIVSQLKSVTQGNCQIRLKIELANEHKEFVSGKKNGKINKIMGQSSVQIIFDNFGEYNFNIEVIAPSYESMKQGLYLVEQEMPASISFHVPDQYHKRIIGIGGQHIQRIMKKHSVFVKFSNAMDRSQFSSGPVNISDDDSRVDNVVCRTPARNAQALDSVKLEILEMVDRADSEFTAQVVSVDRLYHRHLLAHLPEIEELEKKSNCKITFPSTEQASDEVTITGPQWQVPFCVDGFLGMVHDTHELVLARSPALIKFLESPEFVQTIAPKLKSQYEVDVTVDADYEERTQDGGPTIALVHSFTRNNMGNLRDAYDFLQGQLVAAGVEPVIVKGSIARPKSDTFEENLQFFDSKLLQHAPTVSTDSPTKPSFGDEVSRERVHLFDRLRRPGSMSAISTFLDRRKNSSHAGSTLFKGSNNVSKSSLISIESARSFNADRNPWNDSGVNLPDDDSPWSSSTRTSANINGSGNYNCNGHGMGNDHKLAMSQLGDLTPRYNTRQSADSGRPSTSHSTNSGYPGPACGLPR